ncbi:hypothetical protein JTB14_017994 [Gonioctena quinquepunctata]|nr:hypothetical protein JTB14_017994 [Gonioctena quinquepunctata]
MPTTTHRGIDARLQKGWAHAIEKENTLRLKWFRTNEARLNEIANKPPSKAVPEEVKTEFEKNRIESYQNMAKFPRLKAKEPDLIELAALKGGCDEL